jgi:hypothetical protein
VIYGLWLVVWCVYCGEHTGVAKPFFSKRQEAAQLHMHMHPAACALQEGMKGIGLGGVGGEGDGLRKRVAAAVKVEALCDGCFCFEF